MILSKPLSDGSFAVVFLNTGSFAGPHNITVDFKTVCMLVFEAIVYGFKHYCVCV